MTRFAVRPADRVEGRVRVASDKSISHRAFLLGALAEGTSVVHRPLESLDVRATMDAVARLGAKVSGGGGRHEIEGVGLGGLRRDAGEIDCGNSGTLMRLLCGVCVAGRVSCVLAGDESLSGRPMRRVTEPLGRMGASIATAAGGTPPLRIGEGPRPAGIDYASPVASAQVKSAVLLAGLGAVGTTSVTEPAPSRDHTERMLGLFGCPVDRDGPRASVRGGSALAPAEIHVPADLSSAAFFMVAAAIAREGGVVLEEVSVNPTRSGVIRILSLMGADIEERNPRTVSGEPVADVEVRPSRLRGIDIPSGLVPSAIDEFPAIFAAAAFAQGVTSLRDAAELRVKESDRISAMAEGLSALGARVSERDDGIDIEGAPGQIRGGRVRSRGDHRIAMALAVAGSAAGGEVTVEDCGNVRTSFPGFCRQCREVGIDVDEEETSP